MSDGLAEFVLARIADDEKIGELLQRTSLGAGRRVQLMSDVEAKRKIVQRSLDLIASFGDWDAAEAAAAGGRVLWEDVNRRERSHAWAALHNIADIYADHEDYREEWA